MDAAQSTWTLDHNWRCVVGMRCVCKVGTSRDTCQRGPVAASYPAQHAALRVSYIC